MPNTERWALRALSIGEHNYSEIDWAVVTMTTELANRLLARIEILKRVKAEEPDLVSMEYLDYTPQWCPSQRPEDDDGDVEQGGIDSFPDLNAEEPRTEVDRLVVDDMTVRWSMSPKHEDFYVESASLYLDQLRRYLAGDATCLDDSDSLLLPPASDHQTEEA